MISCAFCKELALWVAPRYVGGDPETGLEWLAVCGDHFEGWYKEIEAAHRVPALSLGSKHHRAYRRVLDALREG